MINNRFKAYLAALCSCAFWSLNIILSKDLAESNISPVAISLWRWLIAAMVLFFYCFREIKKNLAIVWQNKWLFVLVGILGISLANTLLYYAAHSTEAINLGLLSAMGPVFILVFSYLILGDSLSLHKIIGILFAIAGLLILITRGNLLELTKIHFAIGDILMLLMLISAGIYTVLSKKKPTTLPSLIFLFYTFAFGLVPLVPAYFILETNYIPNYSWKNWLELLFLGLGPSLLAFITWNYAIQTIGPTVVGMIYFSLPVFVSLLAVFVLGESLAWYHFYGILILGFGVIYSLRK